VGSTETSSVVQIVSEALPSVPIWVWLIASWLIGVFTPTLQKWIESRVLTGEKLETRAWVGQERDAHGEFHSCLFGKAVNVTDAPVVIEFSTAQALGKRRLKRLGRRERHLIIQSGTDSAWPFPKRLERSDALELQYWLPLFEQDWESAVKMRVVFEDSRGREWSTRWLRTKDLTRQ